MRSDTRNVLGPALARRALGVQLTLASLLLALAFAPLALVVCASAFTATPARAQAPAAHAPAVQEAQAAQAAQTVQTPTRVAAAPSALVQAQTPRPMASHARAQPSAARAESPKERWQRLTDAERAELRERFEAYQRLGPREKNELVERAIRLRVTSDAVQRDLPANVREKLDELQPARRREALREIVGGEARERGRDLREKLPGAWVTRLEEARPEERLALLAQFKETQIKRLCDMALDKLAPALGLGEDELQRTRALPLEQRAAAVLELRKRAHELAATENGLPPGMTAADWRQLQKLDPERFFARLQDVRRRVLADNAAREEWQALSPEERANRITPGRLEGLQRLAVDVRPRPEDVVDTIDLSAEERAANVFARRRERCLDILRAYQLVAPARLAEIEALDETHFIGAMRHLLAPLRSLERRGDEWMPAGGGARRGGEGAPAGEGGATPKKATPPAKSGALAPGLRDGGRC
jgi:hypothetical protein